MPRFDRTLGIDIIAVKPSKLTTRQDMEWNLRTRESLQADFSDRSSDERAVMAYSSKLDRYNLNRGVGSPYFARGQRFGRQLSILAIRRSNHEVIAALPIADNVSSSKQVPMNLIEQTAKLHVPRLIEKRWYWAGLCVLSNEARAIVADTPEDEATIPQAMVALGAHMRDARQPAASYPYEGEDTWKQALSGLGYAEQSGSRQPIQAFGDKVIPVQQWQWVATSVAHVLEKARQLEGIDEFLADAARD